MVMCKVMMYFENFYTTVVCGVVGCEALPRTPLPAGLPRWYGAVWCGTMRRCAVWWGAMR